jgi:hypothetical protein
MDVAMSLAEGAAIVILAASRFVAASNRRCGGGLKSPGCGKESYFSRAHRPGQSGHPRKPRAAADERPTLPSTTQRFQ